MLVLDTHVYLDVDRDAAFEGRLVTLLAAWREPIGLSSVVVAELLVGEDATKGWSFWNDRLIAASCARAGATLVTRNADDFQRIGRVIPVAVVPRPA